MYLKQVNHLVTSSTVYMPEISATRPLPRQIIRWVRFRASAPLLMIVTYLLDLSPICACVVNTSLAYILVFVPIKKTDPYSYK